MTLMKNPAIFKASSEENGTGQVSRTPGKGDFRAGVFLEFSILDAFYGLKKVWFFHCSHPHNFQSEKYRLTWDGKCEKFSVLLSLTRPRGGTPDFK